MTTRPDWSDGYVTDILYTTGYYRELSPLYLDFVAALYGRDMGARNRTHQSYCELGFGQGVSFAIHAAANPGRFHGIDFIPQHVTGAAAMLDGVATDRVSLSDASFEEMARDVWQILQDQGQKLVQQQQTLQTDEANLTELSRMAADLEARRPILDVLRIDIDPDAWDAQGTSSA